MILLHDDHGAAFRGQVASHRDKVPHDQRCKTFERFVEQDHPGVTDQRAGNRQHLLFAAGQRAS